ncbi:hypothetical protein ACFL13_02960 [Patescibacteria group bacterium]
MLTKQDLKLIENIVSRSESKLLTEIIKNRRRIESNARKIKEVKDELKEVRGALNGTIRYFEEENMKIKKHFGHLGYALRSPKNQTNYST